MNWLLIGWTDAFGSLQKHFEARQLGLENCSTSSFLSGSSLAKRSNIVIASSFMHYSGEERARQLEAFSDQLSRLLGATTNPNVIFLSSASVYGLSASKKPCLESQPLAPQTDYGREKAYLESLVASKTEERDGRCVIFRPAGYFGKRGAMQRVNSLVDRLEGATSSKKNDQFLIENNGEQFRDFLHVEDLFSVLAQTAATFELFAERGATNTFNVSNGESCSIKTVIDYFQNLHEGLEVTYKAKATDEIHCVLDTTNISRFCNLSSFKSVFSGQKGCPK
jgi:nucleoside-diphosphate-sugar epimerase